MLSLIKSPMTIIPNTPNGTNNIVIWPLVSKRLDQITSLGDVTNELRDVDRELAKIPSGSQFDDARNSWYFRMFNSLEWFSFMINERMITDKKLIEYIKPMIISYYEDTFLKSCSASERDSSRYQHFKKLYQTVKKQV